MSIRRSANLPFPVFKFSEGCLQMAPLSPASPIFTYAASQETHSLFSGEKVQMETGSVSVQAANMRQKIQSDSASSVGPPPPSPPASTENGSELDSPTLFQTCGTEKIPNPESASVRARRSSGSASASEVERQPNTSTFHQVCIDRCRKTGPPILHPSSLFLPLSLFPQTLLESRLRNQPLAFHLTLICNLPIHPLHLQNRYVEIPLAQHLYLPNGPMQSSHRRRLRQPMMPNLANYRLSRTMIPGYKKKGLAKNLSGDVPRAPLRAA